MTRMTVHTNLRVTAVPTALATSRMRASHGSLLGSQSQGMFRVLLDELVLLVLTLEQTKTSFAIAATCC